MNGRLVGLLTFAFVFLAFSSLAWAAGVRTEVSTREAHVGEDVVVRVVVILSEDDDSAPAEPKFPVNGKALVRGPNRSTEHRMSMHNFSVTREQTVNFTWSVTPQALGTLTMGPFVVNVGGQKLRSEAVVVNVVDGAPRTGAGRGRSRRPFDPFGMDPFDPFGRTNSPFSRAPAGLPPAPADLNLPVARDPIAFLHTQLSAKKLVVGEPVVLSVYAYGSRGRFIEAIPTEPTTGDFLSFLVVETSHDQPAYLAQVGEQEFQVVKLRELILVPLKTGTLTIGAMGAILQGRGYPEQGSKFGYAIQGQPLTVEVVEPPLTTRPEGYLLGDVGQFRLEAELEPRRLEAGEYAEVRVRIIGTGNVPSRVQLPATAGVEWQDPVASGGPAVKDGTLGGTRSLKIALRAKEPGKLDLGEIRLPFWDPSAKKYRTARAALGELEVLPTSAPTPPSAPGVTDTAQPKEDAPTFLPRDQLRDFTLVAPLSEPSWLSFALFGLPLSLALARVIAWLTPRLRERFGRSPRQSASKKSLEEAREAVRQADAAAASRHLERALYDAIEEALGLRARAVLRTDLTRVLGEHAVPLELARKLGEIAVECEAVRYASSETSSLSAESANVASSGTTPSLDALWKKTSDALRELSRLPRASAARASEAR